MRSKIFWRDNFQLEKIADRTIEEADTDQDGKISFEEFCRARTFLQVFRMSFFKCDLFEVLWKCYSFNFLKLKFSGYGKNGHRRENVHSFPELRSQLHKSKVRTSRTTLLENTQVVFLLFHNSCSCIRKRLVYNSFSNFQKPV